MPRSDRLAGSMLNTAYMLLKSFGVWAHVSLEGWVAGGILQRSRPFRHVAAAVPVREADGPVEQPALRQQRRIARAGGIAGARVAAPKIRYLGEDSRLDDCSINRRIVRVLELCTVARQHR